VEFLAKIAVGIGPRLQHGAQIPVAKPAYRKTGIEILPDIEGRGVILGLQAIKRKAARQNLQNSRCLNPGFRSIDPNHG
jgi:hypothetical protein